MLRNVLILVRGYLGKMAIVVDLNRCRRRRNNSRRGRVNEHSNELRHGGSASRARLHRLVRGRLAKEAEPVVLAAQRAAQPDVQLERLPSDRQHQNHPNREN